MDTPSEADQPHQPGLAAAAGEALRSLRARVLTSLVEYAGPGHDAIDARVSDWDIHLDNLIAAMQVDEPRLFIDYAAWVKVHFENRPFPNSVIFDVLAALDRCIGEALDAVHAEQATRFINAAVAGLPGVAAYHASYLEVGRIESDVARRFLEALLAGRRVEAEALVNTSIDDGLTISDLYLRVFEPSLREVGRLWHLNLLTVAEEHYVTAATQTIMARLYPRLFAESVPRRNGGVLVATSVEEELHEIGMRMVTDMLELDGWDTHYLGASTPNDELVRYINDKQATVVCVSATLNAHVNKVADTIAMIRQGVTHDINVVVGGLPFVQTPGLWQTVGADATAANAVEAVKMFSELVVA